MTKGNVAWRIWSNCAWWRNLPLNIGTSPAWVCEVHKEMRTPMANNIETKREKVSGGSKCRFMGRQYERDKGRGRQNGHRFSGRLLGKLDY